MRKWLSLAVLLASLPAGCSDSGKRPDTGVEKRPVFEDVPAFSGMEYVDGLAKRNAEFRSSEQKYRGDAKPADVLTFYRKTMPVHGWVLAPETTAEATTLTFTKKSEKCVVTVGTDSYNKAVVTVVLSYKG